MTQTTMRNPVPRRPPSTAGPEAGGPRECRRRDGPARPVRDLARRIGMVAALLAALGGGWLWGASGRRDLDRALRAAELQNDLLEAHVSLLGARVSLYEADFDEMTRQLETARGFVERADARYGQIGLNEEPHPLDGFGPDIDHAQRLAAMLGSWARHASSR
jgi:hypothetical protein